VIVDLYSHEESSHSYAIAMRIPFSLCMTLRMCARLYKHIYARTVACTTRIQNDHTQTTTCKNVQSTSGVFTTSRGDVSRILLDAESLQNHALLRSTSWLPWTLACLATSVTMLGRPLAIERLVTLSAQHALVLIRALSVSIYCQNNEPICGSVSMQSTGQMILPMGLFEK
jgi:hypothetical protein